MIGPMTIEMMKSIECLCVDHSGRTAAFPQHGRFLYTHTHALPVKRCRRVVCIYHILPSAYYRRTSGLSAATYAFSLSTLPLLLRRCVHPFLPATAPRVCCAHAAPLNRTPLYHCATCCLTTAPPHLAGTALPRDVHTPLHTRAHCTLSYTYRWWFPLTFHCVDIPSHIGRVQAGSSRCRPTIPTTARGYRSPTIT